MALIQERTQEQNNEPSMEETVDNKLEFLKFISSVQSSIQEKITTDFVYARLGDKDKEAVVEMTSNAYYSQKLIQIIRLKAKNWTWNNNTQTWNQEDLNTQQDKLMQQHADNLFDAFMTRVYMTVLLNRNVKNNYLVRLMAGASEEEQQTLQDLEEEENKDGLIKRAWKRAKRKEDTQE